MVNGLYALTNVTGGHVVVYERGDTGTGESAGDEIKSLGLSRVAGGEMVVVVPEDCNFDPFVIG